MVWDIIVYDIWVIKDDIFQVLYLIRGVCSHISVVVFEGVFMVSPQRFDIKRESFCF